MKHMMVKKFLLHYTDFKLDVDVYTDVNNYQLRVVIVQKNRPVAFYNRKLTPAQINYTTYGKRITLYNRDLCPLKKFPTRFYY